MRALPAHGSRAGRCSARRGEPGRGWESSPPARSWPRRPRRRAQTSGRPTRQQRRDRRRGPKEASCAISCLQHGSRDRRRQMTPPDIGESSPRAPTYETPSFFRRAPRCPHRRYVRARGRARAHAGATPGDQRASAIQQDLRIADVHGLLDLLWLRCPIFDGVRHRPEFVAVHQSTTARAERVIRVLDP